MAGRTLAPPGDWLGDPWNTDNRPTGGFLLAVTLLAAVLRLYHLPGASLWVDEILTWNMLRPDQGLDLGRQFLDAIQGPLYLLVVWPLVRIQENEWMLRLPAALAGILVVPLFGVMLGRIMEERPARLGVLLLAVSPYHVWYSQEARGYSFLILFVVLLALAYLEMVQKGPTPRRALLVAITGAGAVLSNMSGLFLILAVALAVLVFHRPRNSAGWLWWAVGLGGAVLLTGPWILKASGIWAVDRILPGAATGVALRGQTTFTFMALPYSVYTFFTGYSFGPSLRELHQPDRMAVLLASWPFLVAAAVPVGLGLLSSLRHLGSRRLFLLLLIAVPVFILVVLAWRNIKPWNPRYVSVVFPFLLALLALGLAGLPRRWAGAMVSMMILVSLFSLANHYWNGRYAKADVRAATRHIAVSDEADLPVLAPAVAGVHSFYLRDGAEVVESWRYPALQTEAEALDFYQSELAHLEGFWFVSAREWYFDPQGALPVVLARSGQLHLEAGFPGVRLYRWTATDSRNGDHEH